MVTFTASPPGRILRRSISLLSFLLLIRWRRLRGSSCIESRSVHFFTRSFTDEEDDEIQFLGTFIAPSIKEKEEESSEATPEKEMTGKSFFTLNLAFAQIAHKRARDQEKISPDVWVGVKNPKTVLKKTSSKDSGSDTTVLEKAKTPQVVDAGLILQAPPSRVEGQSPSSKDKGKYSQVEVGPNQMPVNFSLPGDFMSFDNLSREVLFPRLGKFLMPTFHDRYKDVSVDDLGSHVTGLSYMVSVFRCRRGGGEGKSNEAQCKEYSERLDTALIHLEESDRDKGELREAERDLDSEDEQEPKSVVDSPEGGDARVAPQQ
ncbi:hypothetical protein L6452_22621 [Arctium lappa]|uniref:Uncharacterized protein n=1 Tax=Arctium lappa TaxID=4217 RepID=A0ACB9B154_ARCLA|nr:hypothetical protein L6452_22621 [Arctium lappa]